MARMSWPAGLTREIAARPEHDSPFISVIVPVRNEAGFIRATIEALFAQNYPSTRFEVIVVDGRSTDSTVAIVRELQARHANLEVLDNPKCWSSAARNVGIEAARGAIVVVVDGHCEISDRNYLWHLADAFERSGAACVGRPQPLDVSNANRLQRSIAAARSSRLGHNPDSFIYSDKEQFVRAQSVAVAYRKTVFAEIGVFDETFDACEDVEFNHRVDRAGLQCFFTPRVQVHYHPRASLRGLWHQLARYGRGRVRLLRKHPETYSHACFVPAAFLAGVLIGPLLACVSTWLGAVYLGVLALYASLVAGTSMVIAWRERDPLMLFWLPCVFLAIHGGAGAGVLREFFRPQGTAKSPSAWREPVDGQGSESEAKKFRGVA